MISQGFPASVYENPTENKIYILIGAARQSADLDSMLARVKAATSERGKQEFKSAYTVPIDNYVVRKTH